MELNLDQPADDLVVGAGAMRIVILEQPPELLTLLVGEAAADAHLNAFAIDEYAFATFDASTVERAPSLRLLRYDTP